MKQNTVAILCIALYILCLFPFSAAAMDAGPVTASQGETAKVSDISPGELQANIRSRELPHSRSGPPLLLFRPRFREYFRHSCSDAGGVFTDCTGPYRIWILVYILKNRSMIFKIDLFVMDFCI